MIRDLTLTAKNLFFPMFCVMCRRRLLTEENGYFCPTCWELSPRIRRPFCTVCGRPHKEQVGLGVPTNFPCASCRAPKMAKRPFDRIYGAAYYRDAVEEAVKLLKFNDKRRLARPLAALMAEFATREMDAEAYDFLVPVPLYRVRERERGFNQSRLLSEELLPVFNKAELALSLKRIRPTHAQSRLESHSARMKNVRGAFAVVEGRRLASKKVLLIDDVVTTGSTVQECASVLQKAGVRSVDVLAAALAVTSGTA